MIAAGVVVMAAVSVFPGAAQAQSATATDEAVNQAADDVFSSSEFWWKRTSHAETPTLLGRVLAGAYDYVIKPIVDAILNALSKVLKAIWEWLTSAAGAGAGNWSAGIPFLWFAVAALALVVVWRLVILFSRRSITSQVRSTPQVAVQLEKAARLLEQAEAAAQRGDQREAVRLAFLALIAHFQDRGKLTYDRSRSNREYLRDLGPWPDLSAVFRRCAEPFERCWYGGRQLDGLEVDSVIAECRRLALAGDL